MKSFYICLILATFLTILNSCCNGTHECPALSAPGRPYLNHHTGDTVRFVNDNGVRLLFGFSDLSLSSPYTAKNCKGPQLGCSCGYDCGSNGDITFQSDSSRNNLVRLKYSVNEEGQSMSSYEITGVEMRFNLLDFTQQSFSLTDTVRLSQNDSLISNLVLGAQSYTDVYAFAHDTLSNAYTNAYIWKVYFVKNIGIVGFRDRRTQSLFYLE